MLTSLNLILSKNEIKVLGALQTLSKLNAGVFFISTKSISEASDLSIYQARYALLKLEEKGIVSKHGLQHKHRKSWAIIKKHQNGLPL